MGGDWVAVRRGPLAQRHVRQRRARPRPAPAARRRRDHRRRHADLVLRAARRRRVATRRAASRRSLAVDVTARSGACWWRSAGRCSSSRYAAPASNRQIADELVLSVDTVKGTLSALFERFGLDRPAAEPEARRARRPRAAVASGMNRNAPVCVCTAEDRNRRPLRDPPPGQGRHLLPAARPWPAGPLGGLSSAHRVLPVIYVTGHRNPDTDSIAVRRRLRRADAPRRHAQRATCRSGSETSTKQTRWVLSRAQSTGP